MLTRRRYISILLFWLAVATLVVIIAPHFGATRVDVWGALRAWVREGRNAFDNPEVGILVGLRLPRVVLAFLAGAALSLAGAVFQAILRNPLADPYTLGVASGGSLGAVAALFIPGLAISWGPFGTVQLMALLGAGAAVLAIYGVARSRVGLHPVTLLLVGVTVSFFCSAAILLVRYLASPDLLIAMDRWLMGGLDVTGWRAVVSTLPMLVVGAIILLAHAKHYDQVVYGEDLARGRGCPVDRLQKVSFFAGSLLTASVVSVAGPIGFVGLIVPHAMRRVVGPDHRLLLPVAFLAGGAFLVGCDTVSRAFVHELPVGVLTAMLGGPFFLYLLVRKQGVSRMGFR
jgi:iron complex transport system permease protein